MEGSGYFLVNSSEGGIVNMKYREAESAIEVIVVEMLCAREAWVENFKGRFILWKKEEITFFFFFFLLSFPLSQSLLFLELVTYIPFLCPRPLHLKQLCNSDQIFASKSINLRGILLVIK